MAEMKLKEETEPTLRIFSLELVHIEEEPEQLPFTPVSVKTEDEHPTVSVTDPNRGVQFVSIKSEEELGPSLEPVHIKEEPEEEQLQEFPFTPVSVKTEDDEDKSSVLHQRPTEENREEPNGEDCGAQAGCSSDPLTHLHSDSYSSSDTDRSEDWTQEQTSVKRTYRNLNPDSSVSDVGENSEKHKCSECGKGFHCNSELQRHTLIHSGQKPYKCSVCEREFRLKYQLSIHMRTHTGEKPFRCSVCEKGFREKSYLKKHTKTHMTERPFKCSTLPRCSECGKSFRYNSELQNHMFVHTGEKPHRCSVCEKSYRKRSDMLKHLRTHTEDRPQDQSLLKRSATEINNLMEHIGTHSSSCTQDSSVNDEGSHTKRSQRFGIYSYFRKHMLKHKQGPHKCPVCEKCFSRKSSVIDHMTTHTGEKPFSCSVCEKGFRLNSILKEHMRIHTGEKPYSCSVCQICFRKKGNLKVHMRLHSDVQTQDQPQDSSVSDVAENTQKYRCSECGKGFWRNSELQKHEFLHTGQRPYKCSVCDKRFKQSCNVKEHMKCHTGEKPYSCSVCGKSYKRKSTLRIHMKIHPEDLKQDQALL